MAGYDPQKAGSGSGSQEKYGSELKTIFIDKSIRKTMLDISYPDFKSRILPKHRTLILSKHLDPDPQPVLRVAQVYWSILTATTDMPSLGEVDSLDKQFCENLKQSQTVIEECFSRWNFHISIFRIVYRLQVLLYNYRTFIQRSAVRHSM